MRTLHFALALVALLGACGDDEATGDTAPASLSTVAPTDRPSTEPATTAPAPTSPPSLVTVAPTTPPGSPAPPGDASNPLARQAVSDLASTLGVDPSTITVVSVETVTWPDGAIGCPKPGMAYTQVLTDGARIVLEAEGQRYQYHAGGRRLEVFPCETPAPAVGD